VSEQSPPEPPLSPAGGPLPGAQPAAASTGVDYESAGSGQGMTERPEAKIAATFAGGLVVATILKRLAR
jgi:hypothetical protein